MSGAAGAYPPINIGMFSEKGEGFGKDWIVFVELPHKDGSEQRLRHPDILNEAEAIDLVEASKVIDQAAGACGYEMNEWGRLQ